MRTNSAETSSTARFTMAVAVAAAVALGQPALADAPRLWSGTVVNLSDAGEVMRPKVGVDGEGRAIAVWHEYFAPGQGRIMSARRTSSGWSPPRIVASPGTPSPPELTVDPQGHATVAWAVYSPPTYPVQVSRYSPITDTWSLPVTLTSVGNVPHVAADAAGNVLAIWIGASDVEASRYSVTTGVWGPAATLGPPGSEPSLAVNAAGDGVVVWSTGPELVARYFVAAENAWFPMPAVPGPPSFLAAVAIDPAGNVAAAWSISSPVFGVMGAWFDRSNERWRTPVVLSESASLPAAPQVVVDAAGHATALWCVDQPAAQTLVQAARYSATTGVLSAPVTLGSGGYPTVAVDPAGNVVAAWARGLNNALVIESARFDIQAGTWTAAEQLSDPGLLANEQHVAADPLGNVTVVWTARAPIVATIQSTAWLSRLGPPAVTAVTPSANTLAVAFTPPLLVDLAYGPTNYEYSLDNGATWTARDPASTASPVVIAGLSDYVRYPVRLRAVNALGPGLASASLEAIPGVGCAGPCALAVTDVRGNQVTLEWVPPDVGAVPTGYLLEGGLNPGEVLESIPTGSVAPRFTFAAPTGSFYVRIHALAGAIRSGPSPEIRIAVNLAARPSPPTNLRGLVNGLNASLSWTNSFDGGTPTSLWLIVNAVGTVVLPMPVGESFAYANVPPGTYRVSVSAANAYGVSPASEAVTLTFPGPCSGVPEAPVNVQAWTAGTTVSLSWWAPPNGPVATSYVVSVGGAWVGSFTTTGRTLSGAAAPGSYMLSVAAANPCGVGPSTATQTVVIP